MRVPVGWWRRGQNSGGRRRSMRLTVLGAVAYVFLLTAAGLTTLAATLPTNVLWNRSQWPMVRAELNVVAGQNFAFFTRSPESDEYIAYRLQPDGALGASLMHLPQGKPANLFGLSRTQRAQGPEIANLIRAIPTAGWIECADLGHDECVDGIRRRGKTILRNTSPIPTICGEAALTVESTVKWAYRRLTADRYTIEQIAPASIDCAAHH
jgi:antimicrobial peptide system SdpA family protein